MEEGAAGVGVDLAEEAAEVSGGLEEDRRVEGERAEAGEFLRDV